MIAFKIIKEDFEYLLYIIKFLLKGDENVYIRLL